MQSEATRPVLPLGAVRPTVERLIAGRCTECCCAISSRSPCLGRRAGAADGEDVARKLADEAADAPPTADELGAALDRLPLIATPLPQLPHPEMRALLVPCTCSLPTSRRRRRFTSI